MTPERLAQILRRMPEIRREDMSNSELDRADLLVEVDRLTAENAALRAERDEAVRHSDDYDQVLVDLLDMTSERDEYRATVERVEAQWGEGFENDGTYEYSTSGDCRGTWEQRWRRKPALHADASAWEPVGEQVDLRAALAPEGAVSEGAT